MYDSIKEMDKFINLSKNFGLINEAFSNWHYKLPDDPEQILYDFYFFTNFSEKELKSDDETDNVDIDFKFAFKEGLEECTEAVKDHLLHSTMFAMCSEASNASLLKDRIEENTIKNVFEDELKKLSTDKIGDYVHRMIWGVGRVYCYDNYNNESFYKFSDFLLSNLDAIFTEEITNYPRFFDKKDLKFYDENKTEVEKYVKKALAATKNIYDKQRKEKNIELQKNADAISFYKNVIRGAAQLDSNEINQFTKNKKNTVLKDESDSDSIMQIFARVTACVKSGFNSDEGHIKPTWGEVGEYFANIFESSIFNWPGGHGGGYAGKPWTEIAKAFVKIYEAKTVAEKQIWIDHAYDLEHNNATFFDKLNYYVKYDYKQSKDNFRWLKDALNWKRDVKNIEEYYSKVSDGLRSVAAYALKNLRGKSVEKVEIATKKEDIEKIIEKVFQYFIKKEYKQYWNAGAYGYDGKNYDMIERIVENNPNLSVHSYYEKIKWKIDHDCLDLYSI